MIYIISTILFFSIFLNIFLFKLYVYSLKENNELKDKNNYLEDKIKDLKWEYKKANTAF